MVNVLLAVRNNAKEQRAELVSEQEKLLARIIEIGRDLVTLDVYEKLAAAHADANGREPETPKGKGT